MATTTQYEYKAQRAAVELLGTQRQKTGVLFLMEALEEWRTIADTYRTIETKCIDPLISAEEQQACRKLTADQNFPLIIESLYAHGLLERRATEESRRA